MSKSQLKVILLALVPAAAAVLIASCENVAFHSNLDPRNFKEYYKASFAEETTVEELGNTPYKVLGTVQGMACQESEDDYIATERDARTQIRRKAADLGANRLIFGKCVRLTQSPVCKVSVTCYGDAIAVAEK